MMGRGRKPLFNLPIDKDLLSQIREHCFLDDLLSMLTKSNKTDLEKTILTSIYWIGEAQNDFLYESAFIKYWTALETVFTPEMHELFSKQDVSALLSRINEAGSTIDDPTSKEVTVLLTKIIDERNGISESLARGIGTFLVFGGYAFLKIEEIDEIHKKVKHIYNKRCDVVHHGQYEMVTPAELSEVCKYAVWTVLTCLELRTKGYQELEQIRAETNRLFEASIRHSRNQST
jgi:hypothetical protein